MSYIKKHDREQIELLDKYLNQIGLPEKWGIFVKEEESKEYLILKNKKICRCLYCNHEFKSNKKINEHEICPKCNLRLLVKSDRIKNYLNRRDLILIQEYEDGYVLRTFELMTSLTDEQKIRFSLTEWCRKTIDNRFNKKSLLVSNNLKNNMGCLSVAHYENTNTWKPYKYYYGFTIDGKYYYYNFKELFSKINQYSMIWELAKNVDNLNFYDVVEDSLIHEKNTVELLVKAKLYNLANDCKKYSNKLKFEKTFGVDKSYLGFMVENNITSDELLVLSKIKIKDISLIRFLCNFDYELDKLLKYCKPLDLYKYKLNPKNTQEYLDYIRFAIELGFDIRDKKYLYPKHLKQKHDEYMDQIEINKNKKINSKIRARYKKILKNKFENKKYIIKPAASIEELIDESRQQNNCVKTYAQRIAKNECDIYFMRFIDSQDKSLVTIEVKNNYVVQQRTKNNEMTTLEQQKFIKSWETKILRESM